MHLDSTVSAPFSVVSKVPQGSVLGALLFILYTSEFFHIIVNHIVGYAEKTTVYVDNPRPLLRPESQFGSNQLLMCEVAYEIQP